MKKITSRFQSRMLLEFRKMFLKASETIKIWSLSIIIVQQPNNFSQYRAKMAHRTLNLERCPLQEGINTVQIDITKMGL